MQSSRVLQGDASDTQSVGDVHVESRADQADGDTNDAQMAEAAKRDPQAFGELYDRYYDRIYRYVYHKVGSAQDAEDITAISFMKALEALPSYQIRHGSFAPWIFRITRNSVVDHYRRGRPQSNLDDIEWESGEGDPVRLALGEEQRRTLHDLLLELSSEQREVLLLRFSAGLSFTEIAIALKKKEPAIRMLLHRGLRKLRSIMAEDAHES